MNALGTLTEEYVRLGLSHDDAEEEAKREIRLTTGDPYFGRSDEELEAMRTLDADYALALREAAGVSDEFPSGEFAVPGFNC